jgi:14-3-3 protein epsilon
MKYMHLLEIHREKIRVELNKYCHEIIEMIEYQLMQKVPGPEFLVFYLKMKGDFSRYIS